MFGANHKTGTLLAQRLVRVISHGLDADYSDAPSSPVDWEASLRRGASLFTLFRHSRFVSFYHSRMFSDPLSNYEYWVTGTGKTDIDAITLAFPERLRMVADARVVHFIRDPVAIVVSAYLWHS